MIHAARALAWTLGCLVLVSCQTAPHSGETVPGSGESAPKSKILAPYDAAYLGVSFKVSEKLSSGGYGLLVELFLSGDARQAEAGLETGRCPVRRFGRRTRFLGRQRQDAPRPLPSKIKDSPLGRVIRLEVLRTHAGGKSEVIRNSRPNCAAASTIRATRFCRSDRVLHPEWEGRSPGPEERLAGPHLAAHYGFEKDQQELRREGSLRFDRSRGMFFGSPRSPMCLRNPFRNADAAEAACWPRSSPRPAKASMSRAAS